MVIAAAAAALCHGAALIVANPDESHPGPAGDPVPETGSLAAAVLACAGHPPYRIIGKPHPALFLCALDRLGLAPQDAVMIGDNPATDGTGAVALGMRFFNVGGGRSAFSEGDGVAEAPRLPPGPGM